MKLENDAPIAEIREIRHQISEEHCHNPQKVVDYYIELQKNFLTRLLTTPAQEQEEDDLEPAINP